VPLLAVEIISLPAVVISVREAVSAPVKYANFPALGDVACSAVMAEDPLLACSAILLAIRDPT
jgi:hypothetical protein